jgi:hypothetical protein
MQFGTLFFVMLVLVMVGAVMIFMNIKEYYNNPKKKRFKGDDTNPSIGILP